MTPGVSNSTVQSEDASADWRRFALILAGICFISFFLRLGANGLFDLDEALYANAAREMVLRGDYISPQVNGVFFFEKPPFIYWCAALFFHVIGINELAARLPSALASTATSFLILGFGARVFGLRAGFLAGAFYALSPIALGAGRQLTTDATLTLCISLALLSYFKAHNSEVAAGKRWYYGFWAACGVGVLTKGAPGIVLPGAIVFIYLCVLERYKPRTIVSRIVEMKLLSGAALFCLISIPWHIAAWRANGEPFYQEYILRQHLQRFRGGDEAHKLPLWFYIPGFVLGFFPWSVFAIPALLDRSAKYERVAGNPWLFLKIWFWVVFAVFSISGSKLISYILPLYPAAALIAGDWCDRAIRSDTKRRALLTGGVVAFALTTLVFLAVTFPAPLIRLIETVSHQPARVDAVPTQFVTLARHLFGLAAFATGVFVVLVMFEGGGANEVGAASEWRPRQKAVFALILGMATFVLVAVLEGLHVIDQQFSQPLRSAAMKTGNLFTREDRIGVFIGQPRRPSVFFYLPAYAVAPTGELTKTIETTDEVNMDEFICLPGRKVIIADAKRSALVEGKPDCKIAFRSGPWSVFEKAR